MGLFRSKAKKQYYRSAARLNDEQSQALRMSSQDAALARRREQAGDSVWRQPTVGDAIRAWRRKRSQSR